MRSDRYEPSARQERSRATNKLAILGTRGIPAQHGGFETFAERLALYLAAREWDVDVYCQSHEGEEGQSLWRGVRLSHIHSSLTGSQGSILFDTRSLLKASASSGQLLLTLGYNMAVLGLLSRLRGRVHLMNMDGIEWRRAKWSQPVKAWFWINERLACWTADHLVADNPYIAEHLSTRVHRRHITVIPYGADRVENANPAPLETLGLSPQSYVLIVARPEPENSILEMVQAFTRRPRSVPLVVLGNYRPSERAYDRAVLEAAGPSVLFPGAIYDPAILNPLRHHCLFYMHGHQVGGTNPSLVEAMAAGGAVLAKDNPFNRWVTGPSALFFKNADECDARITEVLGGDPQRLNAMRTASYARHAEAFTWEHVLSRYESLLGHWSRIALARGGYLVPPDAPRGEQVAASRKI
ncbi:MAG: glycosyltransferase family 1 protein [Rhodospirillales bacterium]|nr:glycosyltransferase family 1 protein [Rhodospirillales bacterium]